MTHQVVTAAAAPARFGFVVPKTVGSAVRRNLVKRRLRALCAERIHGGLAGLDVVVHALPGSAEAPFEALRSELDAQIGAPA